MFRVPTTKSRDLANVINYPPVLFARPEEEARVYSEGHREKYTGKQITVSEGHQKNHLKGSYEEGGPFYTVRAEYHIPYTILDLKKHEGPFVLTYSGPVHVPISLFGSAPTLSTLASFRPQDTSDLDPYGADAVALCAPPSPVAEVNTGIAESLREGIPSLPGKQLWQSRLGIIKAAGSEFLNTEFGWLPLLDEVKEGAFAVRHASEILEQYERDAGKRVRRSFRFDTERSESSFEIPGIDPAVSGGNTSVFHVEGGSGPAVVSTTTLTDRWFVGAFTYALPSSLDSWKRLLGYGSDANKLLGTTLTPDVLWNLTPWSWAIDWFTDTQEVIKNLEEFKLAGLVMPYGYIMEEKTSDTTITLNGSRLSGHDAQPFEPDVPPASLTVTSKVRRPANPFGFGIDATSLSPLQLAIAAAVGISLL